MSEPAFTPEEMKAIKKATEEAFALFTPEELEKMRTTAADWMSGAEGSARLQKYSEEQALIMYQITADLATGRKVVAGKGGGAIMARAIRDFVPLAERVLTIIEHSKNGGGE